MRMYDIIAKKRDSKELSEEEIRFFVQNYSSDTIPDYQVSALLMAIYINGFNDKETAILTDAMANSGDTIDLSSISGFKVDKHSTGGVGDKTTLVVAPIVAACGIKVAKMSGKGLGHTGGTIDKLESIPGLKTSLTMEEFFSYVNMSGIAVAGQTGKLAPADKKLYSLRDVTATIESIPLIAGSIMSKKLAAGADGIVLDVKTGSGAFMKTLEKSKELAEKMVEIGKQNGRKMAAIVTEMDVPLGFAIGNSLEVIEAIETLKGNGPEDLLEVCITLAAKMLYLAGIGDKETCISLVNKVLDNGEALSKFKELIKNQGGNIEIIEDYSLFGKASVTYEVKSAKEGYISAFDTEAVGLAAVILGAGRETLESKIDYNAGIILTKKIGDKVRIGDTMANLYSASLEKCMEAENKFVNAMTLSLEKPVIKPLILADIS